MWPYWTVPGTFTWNSSHPPKWLPGQFPADKAPRSQVKSRYACRSDDCEHGPSTGHKLTDGYCKEHRDG